MTDPRPRVHKLDQPLAEKFVTKLGTADKLQGIDATLKASDQRAHERAAERHADRMARAANIWRGEHSRAGHGKDPLRRGPGAILKPVGIGLNIIAKPAELLGNAIERLFAPVLTPEQIRRGEIAAEERKADVKDELERCNATADRARERQRQEQEQAARDRQKEIERDR